jgi:hypothetical protein
MYYYPFLYAPRRFFQGYPLPTNTANGYRLRLAAMRGGFQPALDFSPAVALVSRREAGLKPRAD